MVEGNATFLNDIWEELRLTNTGELLGSPLLDRQNGRMSMNIVVDCETVTGMGDLIDQRFVAQVDHLDDYPQELVRCLGGPYRTSDAL